MKKWMASLLALSILAGLTMTGCGEKKEAGNESSSQQKHIESICYVTANLGDKSMSDIANEGLVKAGKEFGPVSYTHLDVYKRQLPGLRAALPGGGARPRGEMKKYLKARPLRRSRGRAFWQF